MKGIFAAAAAVLSISVSVLATPDPYAVRMNNNDTSGYHTTSSGVASDAVGNLKVPGALSTGTIHRNIRALGTVNTNINIDALNQSDYSATQTNDLTITLTNSVAASTNGASFNVDLNDTTGGHKVSFSGFGTSIDFKGLVGTNSATAGTNTYFGWYSGGVWHIGQDTAQIPLAIIGNGQHSGTGNSLLLQVNPQALLDPSILTDDTAAGIVVKGYNAGEALTQWDVVYLGSSSTWLKADADAAGKYPARGVVIAATSNGAAAQVLVNGVFRDDGGTSWTAGGNLYLSTTAAALTQTSPSASGSASQALGYAIATHIVRISPDSNYAEN